MKEIFKNLGHENPSNWHLNNFIYSITDKGRFKMGISDIVFADTEITTIDHSGLFIAAPKSHFDLKELDQNGKGFFKTTKQEIKDPIVFRYVKGGIQVLSKWGLEAEDEMLQQEILN